VALLAAHRTGTAAAARRAVRGDAAQRLLPGVPPPAAAECPARASPRDAPHGAPPAVLVPPVEATAAFTVRRRPVVALTGEAGVEWTVDWSRRACCAAPLAPTIATRRQLRHGGAAGGRPAHQTVPNGTRWQEIELALGAHAGVGGGHAARGRASRRAGP
jgi:hypothetical protein